MPLREIVLYPDPVLREKAEEVSEITPEIQALVNDMVETMYDAPGIGLAAPQVGVSKRIIVLDVAEEKGELLKLINPVISNAENTIQSEEGCLSIPGIRESVRRNEKVEVEALTPEGESIRIEAEGLLAICLQHEIDHLDGVLFIDYLSKLKKKLIQGKLNKLKKTTLG